MAGTITVGNFTFAEPPPDLDAPKPLEKILLLLTDPIFGLEEIKNEVSNIEGNVTDISDIKNQTDKIQMVKDDVSDLTALQYVPFVEHIPGGTCDQAGGGDTRNLLKFESMDNKTFVITELNVFVEGAQDAGDSLTLSVKGVQTGNIITIPSSTPKMINFLGLPSLFNSGTTPTKLNSDLNDNIIIFVTCNAGAANDMSLTSVNSFAWGWKQVDDDIDNNFSVVPP